MKVGIYNETSGIVGGLEFAGAIAETLAGRHDVEIVHHRYRLSISAYTQRWVKAWGSMCA